jgi:hypothetical protein
MFRRIWILRQSRNSNLRLLGARAEKNIYGAVTLVLWIRIYNGLSLG